MSNDLSFLRHETLNILTLVNFMVSDTALPKKQKHEILEQLQIVGLLVSKQDLFLGKAEKTLKQPVNLIELLELVLMILEKPIKEKGVHVILESINLEVMGDSRVIKEGLEHILRAVMKLSKNVHIQVSGQHGKLYVKYNSAKTIKVPDCRPIECLKDKKDYSELALRMAIYSLKQEGIKTFFKKGLVEMVFTG